MNLVYVYDGTLEGLLCCVYESYIRREIPEDIQKAGGQLFLGELCREICTDKDRAEKIFISLRKKIGSDCQDFVRQAFLTRIDKKEIRIWEFISLGYKMGAGVFNCLTHNTVKALTDGIRELAREAHNYTGFIRFASYENILLSRIRPKNSILPVIAGHFTDRYPDENILIWDQTHKMALIKGAGQGFVLAGLDCLDRLAENISKMDEDQQYYEDLWRCFVQTVSIRERKNPVCQNIHLPKKYRFEMTEFFTGSFFDTM